MQKEVQEQHEQDSNLLDQMQKNEELKNQAKRMEENGYKQSDYSLNSKDNKTGEFEINYEKNESSEKIKGQLENGKITNITNTLDIREELEKNPEYQELMQELKEKGFSEKNFDADHKKNSESFKQEFSDQYNNSITLESEGNLSRTNNFNIQEKLSNDYILMLLNKDKKFSLLRNRLIDRNYSTDFQIKKNMDNNYIEFHKQGDVEKVYFKKPELIEKKNMISVAWDYVKIGFEYLFFRR